MWNGGAFNGLLRIILISLISRVGSEKDAPFPGMLYPRESESREVKDLSGIWNFRADGSDLREEGFRERWFRKSLSKSGPVIPMPVPSSFNDITQDSALRDFVGWVWYDRQVYVPRHWRSDHTRVVLRFESAHYNTMVWVNGKLVVTHEGGHLPFEADVTKFLNYDSANRITAAVNNTLSPTTLPPGNIKHLNGPGYPEGYFVQTYQFDFFNYAGIHRPVKLYTTPAVYLSDVTVTTSFSGNEASVLVVAEVTTVPALPKDDSVKLEYELLDKSQKVVASLGGEGLFEGTLTVKNPVLWWPVGMSDQTAYLYTLKVSVISQKHNSLDVYRLPVGIRTVKVQGAKFLINDQPFYFKGLGKHEDSDIRGKGLDYALITKDFNLMHWLGANSFRTSHYPYAEEIMDMADQQGIVVIDETPGVGIRGPSNMGRKSLQHHLDVMAELIRRDKNRPAVVMWSIANEPRSDIPEAVEYFRPLFEYTRRSDPTRTVTFVTQYKAWNDKVVQFVDVILCNRYYAWYHDYGQLQLISRQLEKDLRDWYNEFKKPVVQAEYGADTVAGMHKDPPVMFTEEYQVDSLLQYFPVFDKLREDFFVGEMIWNFADFMTGQGTTRVVGNKKGILTRQREPKAAAHILRRRYWKLTLQQSSARTGDELLDALLRYQSHVLPNATMAVQAGLHPQHDFL